MESNRKTVETLWCLKQSVPREIFAETTKQVRGNVTNVGKPAQFCMPTMKGGIHADMSFMRTK